MLSPLKHIKGLCASAFLAASMAGAPAALAQDIETPSPTDNVISVENSNQPETKSYYDLYNPPKSVNEDLFAGLLIGGGLLYGGLVLYGARRRLKGTWFRAAAGGVILAALCNPQKVTEEYDNLPTDVIIVTDVSASQTLDDRFEQTQAAREELILRLSQIDGIRIRTVEVDSENDDIGSGGTKVFEALRDTLSDIPQDQLGAVLVLTDGQVHDVPEYLNLDENTPLHALISGYDDDFDRSLVIENKPVFSTVGETQDITFRIVESGEQGENTDPVPVEISVDGEVIDTVNVVPGESYTYSMDITHSGANTIVFEAAALDNELTDINNRLITSIEGIREDINVLMISGQPHRGFPILREFYHSNPDVNPVHYTSLRSPLQQDHTPFREMSLTPFPKYEIFVEKLNDFDLVILDNVADTGLIPAPYFNRLADFVEEGGSLMIIANEDYTDDRNISLHDSPLERVLTARPDGDQIEQGFRPEITETGERHPVTRDLNTVDPDSWGNWTRQIPSTVDSGHVVLQGANDEPLLILDEKGEGRVVTLLSDSFWLWARGYQGGGPYASLFENTTSWLLKSPEMDDERVSANLRNGKLLIEYQTLDDEPSSLTILTPSGEELNVIPESVKPGLWQIQIDADQMGQYQIISDSNESLATSIQVGPENPAEYSETISTTTKLQPIVQDRGKLDRLSDERGDIEVPRIVPIYAADEDIDAMYGSDWAGVNMNDKTVIHDNDRKPLIPGWLGAVMIAGLLSAAWLLKEREIPFLKKKVTPETPGGPS